MVSSWPSDLLARPHGHRNVYPPAAVSGFSAGGNMAFSVPLRLQAEVLASQKGRDADVSSVYSGREVFGEVTAATIKAIVAWYPSVDFTRPRAEREKIPKRPDLMMP